MSAVNNLSIQQLAAAAVQAGNNPLSNMPETAPGMHIAAGSDKDQLSKREFDDVATSLKDNGGFSVRPVAPNTGGYPVDAYMTGIPQYRDQSIQNGSLYKNNVTGSKLRRFTTSRRGMGAFDDQNNVLGGWVDGDSAYTDISRMDERTPAGLRKAIDLGNSGKEYGIGVIDDEGNYADYIDLTKIRAGDQNEQRRAWASSFVTARDKGQM